MKKINLFTILIFLCSCLQLAYGNTKALGYPKHDMQYFSNPYTMIKDKRIGNPDHHNNPEYGYWQVFVNKQNAPYYSQTSGNFKRIYKRASFLQAHQVLSKKKEYLQVSPKGKAHQKNLWLKMTDVILLDRSIIHPVSTIYLKAFPLLKIQDKASSLNSLRFRNGPGSGADGMPEENQYLYLSTINEINENQQIYYVYGVHFNHNNHYQDVDQYKYADYYLLGKSPTINTDDDIENSIKGWLPNAATVLWHTRQALQKAPRLNKNLAHIFTEEIHLQHFFCKNKLDDTFLKKIAAHIVRDNGQNSSLQGNHLRYLLMDSPHIKPDCNLQYANIAYYGRKQSGIKNSSPQEITIEDIQKLGKNIEIFFLIDATLSMSPCIKAVAHLIKNSVNLFKDKNITYHSAVYRDINDGIHRFEEWNNTSERSLDTWLNTIKTKNFNTDENFEESLFYGILQATHCWKRKFIYKSGTRLMFVLGDTGNNFKTETQQSDVVHALEENMIILYPIHFIHRAKDSSERIAIQNFKHDMNALTQKLYSNKKLLPFETIDISKVQSQMEDGSTQLIRSLRQNISVVSHSMNSFLNGLSEVQHGQKSMIEMICDKGFNGQMQINCKKCKDLNALISFISDHRSSVHPDLIPTDAIPVDIGFPVALLKVLEKRCSDCLTFLASKPGAGHAEGYIAIKNDGDVISRPVYLLSHKDLMDISYKTKKLINHRACSEEKVHNHIIDGLSVILGQILQTNSYDITKEQLKKWFNVVITDPDRSMLIPNLAKALCKQNKWNALRKKLRKVPDTISKVIYDYRNERLYEDMNELPYFWVYPEELFPGNTNMESLIQ